MCFDVFQSPVNYRVLLKTVFIFVSSSEDTVQENASLGAVCAGLGSTGSIVKIRRTTLTDVKISIAKMKVML